VLDLDLLHLGDGEGQDAVLEDGRGLLGREALGQPQGPLERAEMELPPVVLGAWLLFLNGRGRAEDGQDVAFDGDVDLIGREARERCLDDERLGSV
jgi:hypothetical protein